MIYYANGFAWRAMRGADRVLECAPIEDAADEAAWCEVAGFNAEPDKRAEIEAARDALAAMWWQRDSASLYVIADRDRAGGSTNLDRVVASEMQEYAARSAAKARELMGVA